MGHMSGPDGQATKNEVQGVDAIILSFLLKLQDSPIGDKTNVIIVSDHGMTSNANFVSF